MGAGGRLFLVLKKTRYPGTILPGFKCTQCQVFRWAQNRYSGRLSEHHISKAKAVFGQTSNKSVCNAHCTPWSPRYGQFRFRTTPQKLEPDRPNLGHWTPLTGGKLTNHDAKASHTLPEWIRSTMRDPRPNWHVSQAPFLVILGHFWPLSGPGQSGASWCRPFVGNPGGLMAGRSSNAVDVGCQQRPLPLLP